MLSLRTFLLLLLLLLLLLVVVWSGLEYEQVRSQALSLVQEWGIAFQTDRSLAFAETYGR